MELKPGATRLKIKNRRLNLPKFLIPLLLLSLMAWASSAQNVFIAYQVPTKITINWTGGGVLEKATQLNGPWNPVADATSGYQTQATEMRAFYRVKM